MTGHNDISVPLEELDIKRVTLTAPKKKDDKLVSLPLYDGKIWHLEVTGRAIFGITGYAPKDRPDAKKYSISLSIPDEFASNLDSYDELMLNFGIEHSKTIFGKAYTQDKKNVVEALYTPIVKRGEDSKGEAYPPRIQCKIPVYEGKVPSWVKIYYSQEEEVDFGENINELQNLIKKGAQVMAIIDLKPWFLGGKFGISGTVRQLLIPKAGAGSVMSSYAFHDRKDGLTPKKVKAIDNPSDEDTHEDEGEKTNDDEQAEDSDAAEAQETTEDGEDEREPTPPPKKVTPVVPRKKVVPARK